jgi:hypothetical protein
VTIWLRRWTILLAAASLLLGSWTGSATTDEDPERRTKRVSGAGLPTVPAGPPMDGAGRSPPLHLIAEQRRAFGTLRQLDMAETSVTPYPSSAGEYGP